MIDLDALSSALGMLFSSAGPWLVVVPGILIGLVFGAIPGLQISMAMAIFLPVTLYLDFMQAMLFLTAIFTGGSFGGSIPAILMNIPGTSSAIATAFDVPLPSTSWVSPCTGNVPGGESGGWGARRGLLVCDGPLGPSTIGVDATGTCRSRNSIQRSRGDSGDTSTTSA